MGFVVVILCVPLFLGGPGDPSLLDASHTTCSVRYSTPPAALVLANVGDGGVADSWVEVKLWLRVPMLSPSLEGFMTLLNKGLSNLV